MCVGIILGNLYDQKSIKLSEKPCCHLEFGVLKTWRSQAKIQGQISKTEQNLEIRKFRFCPDLRKKFLGEKV